MNFNSILEKLNLIETILLEIPYGVDVNFKNLRLIVDSDNSHFSSGFNKSNKTYIGNIGKDFFQIRPKSNKYYPGLYISAKGKIIQGEGTRTLKINVNGFDKKWSSSFLVMFSIFATLTLWDEPSFQSVIFLSIGFAFFSFILITVMKDSVKKFKESIILELKSNLLIK